MAQAEDNHQAGKAIVGKMTAEKKKAAIALALVVIMVSLWVKNIMKKNSVREAQALLMAQQKIDVPKEAQFSPAELPQIQGRHDVLTKDVFASNRWKGFRREGESVNNYWTAQAVGGGNSEDVGRIELAVKEMALGAIVVGTERRVFLEGKMLSVGEKFTFKYKRQPYEFKVLEIYDNKVELECDGVIVVKKIKQPQSEDDSTRSEW